MCFCIVWMRVRTRIHNRYMKIFVYTLHSFKIYSTFDDRVLRGGRILKIITLCDRILVLSFEILRSNFVGGGRQDRDMPRYVEDTLDQ